MAIICDLCGGTRFVKEDNYYICQSCGTRYSLEDAKKMVTSEPMQGAVKDNSQAVNYMALAGNAYKAGNLAETEAYCNKALEVDSLNAEAWLLKGKAIGWQSTLPQHTCFP